MALFSRTVFTSAFALIALAAAPLRPAQAQFLISDFNGVGAAVYGGFNGTVGPTYFTVTGQSDGGMYFGYGSGVDLTAYANQSFYVTAQTLPGNQTGINILLSANQAGPANDYLYIYTIPVTAFNNNGFTAAFSSALNNPTIVADAANGYSYVGSGTAFAPDLQSVIALQIQGTTFDSSVGFDYRFDQFSVGPISTAAAPEPGTLSLLGLGLVAGGHVVRRRRKTIPSIK